MRIVLMVVWRTFEIPEVFHSRFRAADLNGHSFGAKLEAAESFSRMNVSGHFSGPVETVWFVAQQILQNFF